MATPKLVPPVVRVERGIALWFRKHERRSFEVWHVSQDLHRLAAKPDRLGPSLAVGQKQSRQLHPVPPKRPDFLAARPGIEQHAARQSRSESATIRIRKFSQAADGWRA